MAAALIGLCGKAEGGMGTGMLTVRSQNLPRFIIISVKPIKT
jgi:hypothetical protein